MLAQDFCGPIGSSDADNAVASNREAMFYLNTANPAPCSGTITSWRVCYYGPNSVDFSTYWATYAIYRRITISSDGSGEHYEKISIVMRAVRATGLLAAVNSTGIIDGSIQSGGFNCYDDFIGAGSSLLTVQAGDILGACVFDPIDGDNYDRRQLDVVGEAEMDGEFLLGMSSSGRCTTDALPSNIPISQLSMVSSRRLHIYANIGNHNYQLIIIMTAILSTRLGYNNIWYAHCRCILSVLIHISFLGKTCFFFLLHVFCAL